MTLAGLKTSTLLKKRVNLLENTVSFLLNFKIELQYRGDTLYVLLRKISELSVSKKLDYIKQCCENLEAGLDFPEAWKKAVKESSAPYTAEEKIKLISLAEHLGTTDVDSQSTILALYGEYFTAYLKKAHEVNEKYSKLCSALGFVSGFGFFIMAL